MANKVKTNKRISAFSLIELAIVIVIIGVLASIFFAGQGIMQSYKVSSVVSEISYYENAKNSFRDQYNYRPGDVPTSLMSNYFDDYADDDCGGGSYGNNQLDSDTEKDLAWIQLSNVNIIRQQIRFNPCAAGNYREPGIHRPLSDAVKAAGWTFLHTDSITIGGDTSTFYYITRIGRKDSSTDKDLEGGALPVALHMAIDAKVDMPYTPVSGRYYVGEECIDVDGSFKDEQDKSRCTGNFAEIDPLTSGTEYTP